ncbi:MAG: carbon-nitrogen hydrolase family protein [Bacteroidia bacterium]|nr:carbon-nitrogen hydrolase family protein [Bacteroidia bacterium]
MIVKVGVVQESPVFLDKKGTLDKLENLVKGYASENYNLLVFPESFIPGYPRGFDFGTRVGSRSDEGRELYKQYREQSIDLESYDLKYLETLSKENEVYLVIGVTEKQSHSGSLYCSMLYISPTDGLMGVHRKIKPTGSERVIWAEAAGESLVTFQTKIGRLGGLICWENYMPQARMSMYGKGVEIYIAPTADARDSWISTMKHIALEGRCFVLGCNQFFTKSMYPESFQSLVKTEQEIMCKGGSVIVSPLGEIIQGPLFDTEGILSAELDLEDIGRSKLDFDVIGHYSRPDIFSMEINGQPDIIQEKSFQKPN